MLISSPKLKNSELDFLYLEDEFCFILSEDIVEKCLNYAEEKKQYNDYLISNRAANPEKIFNQDAYSKLAEFAAQEFLAFLGVGKLEVDTKVYPPNQKNWDSDLGNKIGVKSTSLELKNFISRHTKNSTQSWSFQWKNKKDNGGNDKGVFGLDEIKQKEKFFILVSVESENISSNPRIWIRSLVSLHRIIKLLKDPIKEIHKGRTKVIYDGDLKSEQLNIL